MSKIFFQGTFGAYSHLAALSIDPKAEIVPCKTFDECFLKASKDDNSKIIIPESNRITGNIGIEYLIFKYRLNIYSEYFQKIEHNLLSVPGAKLSEIKDVYSHGQALSQCSKFIKSNKLIEHVRADTAGSAEMVSKEKDRILFFSLLIIGLFIGLGYIFQGIILSFLVYYITINQSDLFSVLLEQKEQVVDDDINI